MADADHEGQPLPLSYKITIVVSVLLIFLLGLFYFSLRNQRVATSFQVYGPATISAGLPSVYRVLQFDNLGSQRNLPVRIVTVRFEQEGKEVASQPGTTRVAEVPAEVQLQTGALHPGPVRLHFDLEGWNGEQRSVVLESTVADPTRPGGETFALRPALPAPLAPETARFDLTLGGGGLVEAVDNRLWLRLSDADGKPVSATPRYRLGAGEVVTAPPSGRLGIVPLTIRPEGPNQNLVMDVDMGSESITWEEMVAPEQRFRLRLDAPLVTAEPPVQVTVMGQTDAPSLTLFCTLWRNDSALEFHRVDAADGALRIPLTLPVRGLYWLTCDDHFLAAEGFQAYQPIIATARPEPFIKTITALLAGAGEPGAPHWPPFASLTPAEQTTLVNYLAARLAPQGPAFSQLANTYAGDVEALAERAGMQRDIVLGLIGLVGLGLLFWAVAVAILQHRKLARSFREFQEGEDVGEDLAAEGIVRRKSYLPAILIVLTVLANLAALIWLLRLVFF